MPSTAGLQRARQGLFTRDTAAKLHQKVLCPMDSTPEHRKHANSSTHQHGRKVLACQMAATPSQWTAAGR